MVNISFRLAGLLVPGVLACLFSCNRMEEAGNGCGGREELRFSLSDSAFELKGTRSGEAEGPEGFSMDSSGVWFAIATRVEEVSSIEDLDHVVWGAVTPTGVWTAAAAEIGTGGIVNTGHYLSSSSSSNTYYVTNTPNKDNLSITQNSVTLTVDGDGVNGTDIVVGKASSSASHVQVNLEHIFCRTGEFTFTASSGLTVSNLVWRIKGNSSGNGLSGTAGKYDLMNMAWSEATNTLSQRNGSVANWQNGVSVPIDGLSDLYLIPGKYDVTVECRITYGGVSKDVSRTGTVEFSQGGKVYGIKAGIGCDYELSIFPDDERTIGVGDDLTYSASLLSRVRFGNNEVAVFETPVTGGVSWSSSNAGVATVSGGTATGKAAGTTTITASYTPSGASTLTASVTLKVEDVRTYKYRFEITPRKKKIGIEMDFTFSVVRYTDEYVNGVCTNPGDKPDPMSNSDFTWTVEQDYEFVTINQAGAISGVGVGHATITATLKSTVQDYDMYSNVNKRDQADVYVVSGSWDDGWDGPDPDDPINM